MSAILDNIVINSPIKFNQIRYSIDNKKGSLGKKIRDAVKMKIPVQIIIGERDMDNKEVSIRIRKNGDFIEESISLSDLEAYIKSI
ncbi:Threonine--tRNA ligase [Chlamydia trachomatis]|nr:Threonine--tRNA ligase [Chlamydia trachomatis]